MKRVEVTHVAPSAFGAGGLWGGGERYPLALAEAMSARVPTRLLVFGRAAARERVGQLDIRTLPVRAHWRNGTVNPLSEQLAAFIPLTRRLHVHQYQSVVTNLVLAGGRLTRRDVFVTDHGGASFNYADRFRLERFVAAFLPVSRFSAGFFPQLASRTAEPLLGGADVTRFAPGPEPRERKLIYVGRLLPHKGIDVVLRAIDATIPFHVYGRVYDETYRAHLTELARGKDVHFHEHATDAEIALAYRTARAAVLPSVYTTHDGEQHPYPELLGLTLIEAMASATPVIASRVGGIPEIVRHGGTGFLVEPGDVADMRARIDALIDDSPAWRQMSQDALRWVRDELTWDRVAERCLETYARYGR